MRLGTIRSDKWGTEHAGKNTNLECFLWSTISCDLVILSASKLTLGLCHYSKKQLSTMYWHHKYKPEVRNIPPYAVCITWNVSIAWIRYGVNVLIGPPGVICLLAMYLRFSSSVLRRLLFPFLSHFSLIQQIGKSHHLNLCIVWIDKQGRNREGVAICPPLR